LKVESEHPVTTIVVAVGMRTVFEFPLESVQDDVVKVVLGKFEPIVESLEAVAEHV